MKMACKVCASENSVTDQGFVWCVDCGLQMGRSQVYVQGYQSPQTYRHPFPVYSRIKRFVVWLREMRLPLDNEDIEDILRLFSVIEFTWGCSKKARSYFFNKGCVLQFILDTLEIPFEVHTLKDPNRVDAQMQSMRKLLEQGASLFY